MAKINLYAENIHPKSGMNFPGKLFEFLFDDYRVFIVGMDGLLLGNTN